MFKHIVKNIGDSKIFFSQEYGRKDFVPTEIRTHDLSRESWTLCYLGHPSQKQSEPKPLVYIYNGTTSPSFSHLVGIGNLGKMFVEARYI